MSRRTIFCTVIVMFLFMAVMQADADSSSLFRMAGTVQPMQNNNVRMVEEKVDIQVYGGWSVVRCEFIFRNESDEEQAVLMGFPASMIGEGFEIDKTTRLRDFKIYDNGVEKKAELEKAKIDSPQMGDISEWHTWDLHFQGGEELKIVNTYKAQNYNAPWGRHTGYILETGTPWKGTIGKAVITFELMDIAPSNIYAEYTSPKGYRLDRNKVIWEMEDFEPTENIHLELSGYWSIYNILYGQNEEKLENVRKQIEQAKLLFIDGNEEESLSQVNLLLQQDIYAEELYFCLLNYYHMQGDIDGFIRVLKDEMQHLNNPYVFEWAKTLYPDRLKSEGLTYPEEHKPVIRNQSVRKLNDTRFELMADLYDEAGDMTFLTSIAYTDALSLYSILEEESKDIPFGFKNYSYRAEGVLLQPCSDLIWKLDISDYKGNTEFGRTLDEKRLGWSCYFYDGSTFEPWNLKKDSIFTLCYYDKSFDPAEGEFGKTLASRLQSTISKLDISIPTGGYTINLYEKSHVDKLKKGSPQSITLYLKKSDYKAELHNDKAAGISEEEAGEWDWGEIIAELDPNNKDKMVAGILLKILENEFGAGWQEVKPEIADAFIATASGEPGKGRYYEVFSKMTKTELIKATQEIGSTGKPENLPASNDILIYSGAALLLTIGIISAIYIRKYKIIK